MNCCPLASSAAGLAVGGARDSVDGITKGNTTAMITGSSLVTAGLLARKSGMLSASLSATNTPKREPAPATL